MRPNGLHCLILLALLVLTGCYVSMEPEGTSLVRPVFELPATTSTKIGDVNMTTFKNGLTLLHKQTTNNEIVGLVLYIKTGAAEEMPEKAGLTNLMMRVLAKGTKNRTADEIAEETASLGAALSPSAGNDYCTVSMQCVKDDLPVALELLADITFNPTFPLDEVELERRRVLASIRMGEDQVSVVAAKRFMRELYGAHSYGIPLEGEVDTLPEITPQDLSERHQATFVPSNMVFSVVGNVNAQKLSELIEANFGQVMLAKDSDYRANKIIAPGGSRAEIFKDSEQGYVVLGHLTCPVGHPDEPAVKVASAILGGGMSSRLFAELRDRQGLAYSVGARATFFQLQGHMMAFIGTSAANLAPSEEFNGASRAEHGLWNEIQNLRETPVTDEELERAKNYIAGAYLRAHERNVQQASYYGFWHLTGRGVEYDQKYVDSIREVTSRDIMRVANKYFLEPTIVVLRPLETPSAAAQ